MLLEGEEQPASKNSPSQSPPVPPGRVTPQSVVDTPGHHDLRMTLSSRKVQRSLLVIVLRVQRRPRRNQSSTHLATTTLLITSACSTLVCTPRHLVRFDGIRGRRVGGQG
jgi:hypothetical protein